MFNECLKCGPPRVDFIGSSGQGATGSSIVNALGQIIGVSINGPGFGFEEPPLLSFLIVVIKDLELEVIQ